MSISANTSAFTSDDFHGIYPKGIERHYWNHARNYIIRRKIINLVKDKQFLEPQVVLDIGCGRGIVTSFLRKGGIDCWGCDLGIAAPINDDTAPYLLLGIEASRLPEDFRNKIDTILLLDVLEHIDDTSLFLSVLYTSFPNADNIIFTVPARQELFSNYDVRNRHFRRYDSSNINNLSIPNTYRLTGWSYFFHGLYFPARIMALLGINRGTELRAPKSPQAILIHSFVAAFFVMENLLLPKRWVGSSIKGLLKRI